MNHDNKKDEAFKPQLPIDYFDLQYQFALKAKELTGKSLEDCLMEYTAFYKRIGVEDWDFDTSNPLWLNFLKNGSLRNNFVEEAYKLYLENELRKKKLDLNMQKRFDCFRFDYDEKEESISLHFSNRDKSKFGPLSKERFYERLKELKEMFNYIKINYPSAKYVETGSWLLNYESFKRLLPSAFTSNMETEEIPFPRSDGVWGQFVNSERLVNQEVKEKFLAKVQEAKTVEELLQAFPLKLLIAKGDISEFYQFYDLELH